MSPAVDRPIMQRVEDRVRQTAAVMPGCDYVQANVPDTRCEQVLYYRGNSDKLAILGLETKIVDASIGHIGWRHRIQPLARIVRWDGTSFNRARILWVLLKKTLDARHIVRQRGPGAALTPDK